MATRVIVECDVCGVEVQNSTEWKVGVTGSGTFLACKSDGEYEKVVMKDACGREHAQKLFERYLHSGSLEEPTLHAFNEDDIPF